MGLMLKYRTELTKGVGITNINCPFFRGDKKAHSVVVEVLENGIGADLSEYTATLTIADSTGASHTANCTITGSVVGIELPADAYAYAGREELFIRLVNSTNESITTIWVGTVMVEYGG